MIIMLAAALAAQQAGAADVSREAFTTAVDTRFAGIDADGNGQLDTAELDAAQARIVTRIQDRRRQAATANFAATDTDGNGKIDLAEWQDAATRAPLRVWTGTQLLISLDSDKDGRVSLDEYRAAQLDHFDDRDTDVDGAVSTAERTIR